MNKILIYFMVFFVLLNASFYGIKQVFPTDCAISMQELSAPSTNIFNNIWDGLLSILTFGISNFCDIPIGIVSFLAIFNTIFYILSVIYIIELIRGVSSS